MIMADVDAEAQFQTAMAMLAGNSLSADWKRAAGLIDAAAAAGHADALERRALLECRGVGRPISWGNALDSLAIAAERGSQSAARQMILLADNSYQQAGSIELSPDDWREMRSRVRIAERLSAPAGAGRVLSALLERAVVYNNPTGIDSGRTNQFAPFNFSNADLVVEVVRQRIANQLGAPLACLEMSQVLHYGVGQEFVLHCDFLDPQALREEIARNGQRVATVLIYLNQDFEGGQTSFPRLGIDHRGRTGDALVFGNIDAAGNPDPRSQHAGCPPISGEKWVFSQWVRNRSPDRD